MLLNKIFREFDSLAENAGLLPVEVKPSSRRWSQGLRLLHRGDADRSFRLCTFERPAPKLSCVPH